MIGNGVIFEFENSGERFHSYADFGMILTARPIVSPPEPFINLVDVYGRDKPLDFTEALDGKVHYKARTVGMSFMRLSDPEKWATEYSKLIALLHGKRVRVYLDDDPNWFYDCRLVVSEPSYKKHAWYVSISGTADPYKYYRWSTIDEVPEWAGYEDGIERYYRDIEVGSSTVFKNVMGFDKDVIPIFHFSGTDGAHLSITINGNSVSVLGKGEDAEIMYRPDYPIHLGMNSVQLRASAAEGTPAFRVSIEYREMRL